VTSSGFTGTNGRHPAKKLALCIAGAESDVSSTPLDGRGRPDPYADSYRVTNDVPAVLNRGYLLFGGRFGEDCARMVYVLRDFTEQKNTLVAEPSGNCPWCSYSDKCRSKADICKLDLFRHIATK
jgi:hypothetical protein